MSSVHRLPNGYLVLLMTPREATHISDLLLDPDDFPWNGSEQQMTGLEARLLLRAAVSHEATHALQEASDVLVQMAEAQRRKEEPPGPERLDEDLGEAASDGDGGETVDRLVPSPQEGNRKEWDGLLGRILGPGWLA